MNYNFKIEGAIAGMVPGATSGIPMKTEGKLEDLPPAVQPILKKMIDSPEAYSASPPSVNTGLAVNKIEVEDKGVKYNFEFDDVNIPDEVLPLITYLRKKSF